MLLLGLDAAADLRKFGYAFGRLTLGAVELLDSGTLNAEAAVNDILAPRLQAADRALIAIDAPLGWPAPLSAALREHRAGKPFADQPNELFRRTTDQVVRQVIGQQSLDVGADRIACAAWRALAVLGDLRNRLGDGLPLAWSADLPGRFGVIEVYPAATLKAWGVPAAGYKKPEAVAARRAIARRFVADESWLKLLASGPVDVFDAGLCLIAARDFLAGDVVLPKDLELAQREGWIWVKAPTGRATETRAVQRSEEGGTE